MCSPGYSCPLEEIRLLCKEFYENIECFHALQVLNWKLVDFELAIGLCTILPKAEVLAILWRIITNAWQNYDKITVMLQALYEHSLCMNWSIQRVLTLAFVF